MEFASNLEKEETESVHEVTQYVRFAQVDVL